MYQAPHNAMHEAINAINDEYGNVNFIYIGKGRFGENQLEHLVELDEHICDGRMPGAIGSGAGRQACSEDVLGDDAASDYSSF